MQLDPESCGVPKIGEDDFNSNRRIHTCTSAVDLNIEFHQAIIARPVRVDAPWLCHNKKRKAHFCALQILELSQTMTKNEVRRKTRFNFTYGVLDIFLDASFASLSVATVVAFYHLGLLREFFISFFLVVVTINIVIRGR